MKGKKDSTQNMTFENSITCKRTVKKLNQELVAYNRIKMISNRCMHSWNARTYAQLNGQIIVQEHVLSTT